MRRVILASRSPRRQTLLDKLGVIYENHPSESDEELFTDRKPSEAAAQVAKNKAETVGQYYDDAIIIAADTVVVCQSRVFGKPADSAEARDILRMLSGTSHEVITALAVLDTASGIFYRDTETTRVFFRKLLEEEITAYIASGEPFDKAGAYGIQGLGGLLVEKIEGCYYNVVGLPLSKLYLILKPLNVDLLRSQYTPMVDGSKRT